MRHRPDRAVVTDQREPHPELRRHWARHRHAVHRTPVPAHTQRAFDQWHARWLAEGRPAVWCDFGCGTGASCHYLREQKKCAIVGVDRSVTRLGRGQEDAAEGVQLVRADMWGWVSCLRQRGVRVAGCSWFYPNPAPKAAHLHRRVWGHPLWPHLAEVTARVEVRTNWDVGAQECHTTLHWLAADVGGAAWRQVVPVGEAPMSLFERKYRASGQTLWAVGWEGVP